VTLAGTTVVNSADGGSWTPTNNGSAQIVWVTGPNTIVIAVYAGGGAHSTRIQAVAGTAEVPINWTLSCQVPYNGTEVPYEYAAAMCAQLGCDYWLNLPHTASDACIAAIAQKVIANIGPNAKVWIEHGNELWNPGGITTTYHGGLAGLIAYLPANT